MRTRTGKGAEGIVKVERRRRGSGSAQRIEKVIGRQHVFRAHRWDHLCGRGKRRWRRT